MTRKTSTTKASQAKTRRQHSPEFRKEALALAESKGVSEAAQELGLHSSQLYGWRTKAIWNRRRLRAIFHTPPAGVAALRPQVRRDDQRQE